MVFRLLLLLPLFLHAQPGYFTPWGTDISLLKPKETYVMPKARDNLLSQAFEKMIGFHQTHLNQIDGPRSHFRPCSSQYMLLSMRRYGVLKGYLKGCDRLLRENRDPWVYRTRVIAGKTYKYDPTY